MIKINRFYIILYLLLFLSSFSHGKKNFLLDDIPLHFNEENPYFYAAIGKEYVNKAEELFYEGAFDTELSLKYDEKDYGASTGTYQELKILKPLENGLNLFVSYRNAQGVQEYNNIKTGNSGEILTGVNIPLMPLIHNTNQRKTDIQTAKLKTKSQQQVSQSKLLSLYINISKLYYQLLFKKELISTEKELLLKAQKNFEFIEKEVNIGTRAAISLLEIESQIINRKKRLLNAQNNFKNHKNIFLQYLNLDKEKYDKQYQLPKLSRNSLNPPSLENALTIALKNRAELKKLAYDIDNVELQSKQNSLKKYPKIDLNLYSNYDLIYKEGYKVSVNLNFPFKRRAFKGKNDALKREKMLLSSHKENAFIELRTNLTNILQNISQTEQNVQLKKEELTLVSKLNEAEEKKYKAGLSNLIFLNQREIKVIEIQQALLQEYYRLRELELHLEYELGRHPYQL